MPPRWTMDRRTLVFLAAGLAVALAVAGGLSLLASDEPDGLERVSIDQGFADQAEDHTLEGGPLSDYEIDTIGNDRWGSALAGMIGVLVTLTITLGVLWMARRWRRSHE